MVSKKIATEKKGGAQQKQRAEEKSEQMVLICDEASQTLMIVNAEEVLSLNKISKVDTGMQITWYDDSDEQIIGPILAIECTKAMATIKKTLGITKENITKPNTEEQQPLHSTITIEDNNIPHSQLHDDESRDSHSSAVHIMEDEETQENSSLVPTSDNSNTQKSSRGEKRRSEELSTNANNRKKLSNASLSVSYPIFSAKEQECLALQGELDYYKQEWMQYTKISNPADTASEASIRHAMSNYVAVQKFKNRLSQIPTPNQLPEEGNEDGEDNDN
ncbi:unnamed protein product [Rotaria magnacalcarata]